MISLAVKYRPQHWDEVVEQDYVKKILKYQADTNTIKHAYLFCGTAGSGKAQPLYSKILTPQGWISMGSVTIGTLLYTHTGAVAQVTGIYPQGMRDTYRITLSDGTSIDVSDEHLNVVYRYNQNKKCREDFVLTTKDLISFVKSSPYKIRVDIPSVDWGFNPVPVDPYLLGCLIGDGGLASGDFGFSNKEDDVVAKVDVLLRRDWQMYLQKKPGNNVDYNIRYIVNPGHNGSRGDKGEHKLTLNFDPLQTLKGQLERLGLRCKSVDKHIPTEYLYNSREVRLSLLQGLFDTDGTMGINKNTHGTGFGCAPSFNTSSKQLSEDFCFLCRSLGIRVSVRRKKAGYKVNGAYKQCADNYEHYLKIPANLPFFTSKKHTSRFKTRQNEPIRNIVSIEYIGKQECQCIFVDHPDHTYISDDFIPTHNTTSGRLFANYINNDCGNIIEVDAASNNGVDQVRTLIAEASVAPIEGKYKVIILDEVHSLSNSAFQALLKTLEEPPATAVFILCTTDPQKIPETILSRVQRYNFSKISLKGIADRLQYILEQENKEGKQYTYEQDAIQYIAKLAQGGMRAGITMMDKCLSLNPNLTMESVVSALGTVDYDTYFNLLLYIGSQSSTSAIKVIEDVYNAGKDIKNFMKNFEYFVLDVCKYKLCKSFDYVDIPNLPNYVQSLEDEDYTTDLQVLDWCVKTNMSCKYETNAKAVVESNILLFGVQE